VLVGLVAAVAAGIAGPVPTPIGAGPRYRPPAAPARVLRGEPVGDLRCGAAARRFGVHLELFAHGRVVIVPAGIGIAPPRRRSGAYVASGRCEYPAITVEPTGVVQVARGGRLTLGDFFAIWSQPLSSRRLAGFAAPARSRVRAFVGGREWASHVRAVPLTRHAQIVLEIGGYVPPHRRDRFPPGL
jgi:hypothetical protein